MNPARTFGPALAGGYWNSHFVYWIGPLLGGIGAAHAYDWVRKSKKMPDDGAVGGLSRSGRAEGSPILAPGEELLWAERPRSMPRAWAGVVLVRLVMPRQKLDHSAAI